MPRSKASAGGQSEEEPDLRISHAHIIEMLQVQWVSVFKVLTTRLAMQMGPILADLVS